MLSSRSKLARAKRLMLGVMKYFRERSGSPFILGFEILLLVCAGLILTGNLLLANGLAVFAYYLLLIGVALQFFAFIKEQRKERNE
jgi:hypothetical protein